MSQETKNNGHVKIVQAHFCGWLPETFRRMLQEQTESIPVSGNGPGADIALVDEVLIEEVLENL
jgi:hypothetical protein